MKITWNNGAVPNASVAKKVKTKLRGTQLKKTKPSGKHIQLAPGEVCKRQKRRELLSHLPWHSKDVGFNYAVVPGDTFQNKSPKRFDCLQVQNRSEPADMNVVSLPPAMILGWGTNKERGGFITVTYLRTVKRKERHARDTIVYGEHHVFIFNGQLITITAALINRHFQKIA